MFSIYHILKFNFTSLIFFFFNAILSFLFITIKNLISYLKYYFHLDNRKSLVCTPRWNNKCESMTKLIFMSLILFSSRYSEIFGLRTTMKQYTTNLGNSSQNVSSQIITKLFHKTIQQWKSKYNHVTWGCWLYLFRKLVKFSELFLVWPYSRMLKVCLLTLFFFWYFENIDLKEAGSTILL